MRLAQILFTQGFGTRRECEGMIASGQVSIDGQVRDDSLADIDTEGLAFRIGGVDWPYRAHALIVLNKPAGYECSQKPRHHPSVYSLLPTPLRRRGVQAIGRLDEDTTGLLLFTDDGALIHRLTSPRHHVAKVYDVTCTHAVVEAQAQCLRDGVMLLDESTPVRAVACEVTGTAQMRLTLTQGKYHQVKRMVAAAGNRVEALHRSSFGALALPGDLAGGSWRWLDGPHVLAAQPTSTDRKPA